MAFPLGMTWEWFGTALPTGKPDVVAHPFAAALKEVYEGSPHKLLKAALQNKNILGQGSRALVYRIPGMKDYVLRAPKRFRYFPVWPVRLQLEVDPLPHLNIGQTVASLYGGKVLIQRYQPGITYQIPYGDLFKRYDIDAVLGFGHPINQADIQPYRAAYKKHLEKIAAMPQSAFNQLAGTILQLKRHGLFLDPCSLNILVDEEQQCFRTIDHLERIGPYENVLGMSASLLDAMFVDLDEHAIDASGQTLPETTANDSALVSLRYGIMQKILIAAFQTGLELPETACPLNHFGFHQRSFDMQYILKISGMAGQWPLIQELFAKADQTSLMDALPGMPVAA